MWCNRWTIAGQSLFSSSGCLRRKNSMHSEVGCLPQKGGGRSKAAELNATVLEFKRSMQIHWLPLVVLFGDFFLWLCLVISFAYSVLVTLFNDSVWTSLVVITAMVSRPFSFLLKLWIVRWIFNSKSVCWKLPNFGELGYSQILMKAFWSKVRNGQWCVNFFSSPLNGLQVSGQFSAIHLNFHWSHLFGLFIKIISCYADLHSISVLLTTRRSDSRHLI